MYSMGQFIIFTIKKELKRPETDKYIGFLLPIQGIVIQFCLSEVPLEFVQVMDEL